MIKYQCKLAQNFLPLQPTLKTGICTYFTKINTVKGFRRIRGKFALKI
jgi:hypothetical protein